MPRGLHRETLCCECLCDICAGGPDLWLPDGSMKTEWRCPYCGVALTLYQRYDDPPWMDVDCVLAGEPVPSPPSRSIYCPQCGLLTPEPAEYPNERDGVRYALALCPACLTAFGIPQ